MYSIYRTNFLAARVQLIYLHYEERKEKTWVYSL